jgi:hypothetical protein
VKRAGAPPKRLAYPFLVMRIIAKVEPGGLVLYVITTLARNSFLFATAAFGQLDNASIQGTVLDSQ